MRAQTCAYCGAISLWDEAGHRDSGKRSMLPEGFTRLYTAATGSVSGRPFQVLGRARYGFERGFWDEWYVRFLDEGDHAWITEDDHQLALEAEIEARVEGELTVGNVVKVDGTPYMIRETGRTTCLGIEGQLPKEVLPGETYAYADGSSLDGTRALGVELDEEPPTIFVGTRLSHEDLTLDDEGEDW